MMGPNESSFFQASCHCGSSVGINLLILVASAAVQAVELISGEVASDFEWLNQTSPVKDVTWEDFRTSHSEVVGSLSGLDEADRLFRFSGLWRGVPSHGGITVYAYPQAFSYGFFTPGDQPEEDLFTVRVFNPGVGNTDHVFRPDSFLAPNYRIEHHSNVVSRRDSDGGWGFLSATSDTIGLTLTDRVHEVVDQYRIEHSDLNLDRFSFVPSSSEVSFGDLLIAGGFLDDTVDEDHESYVLFRVDPSNLEGADSWTIDASHLIAPIKYGTMLNEFLPSSLAGVGGLSAAPIGIAGEPDSENPDMMVIRTDEEGRVFSARRIDNFQPAPLSEWSWRPRRPAIVDDGKVGFISANSSNGTDSPVVARIDMQTGDIQAAALALPGQGPLNIFEFAYNSTDQEVDSLTVSLGGSRTVVNLDWPRADNTPTVAFSAREEGTGPADALYLGDPDIGFLFPGPRGGSGKPFPFLFFDESLTEAEGQSVGLAVNLGLTVMPVDLAPVDIIDDFQIETMELTVTRIEEVTDLPFTRIPGGDLTLVKGTLSVDLSGSSPTSDTPELGIKVTDETPHMVELSFRAVGDEDYTIQSSPDLRNWQDGPEVNGAVQGEEITRMLQSTDTKSYYRLKIRSAP